MSTSLRYSVAILRNTEEEIPKTYRICQQTATTVLRYHPLHIPSTFVSPPCCVIETAQKWITLVGKNGRVHKFPVTTVLPKVQMSRYVPAKTLPRDVEVDRRRRQYAKLDLDSLLAEANVAVDELLPTLDQFYSLPESSCQHFLPLSIFDDTSFDSYSPEAWLKLGEVDGEQYPLPAKAFVPHGPGVMDYSWQYTAVSNYNVESDTWTALVLNDECVYKIPTIHIMFLAENAHTFVQRLQKAIEIRNKGEEMLMMEHFFDCFLMHKLHNNKFRSNACMDKLLQQAANADPVFQANLRAEVYLVFEHVMAYYKVIKCIKMCPLEFPDPDVSISLINYMLPKAFLGLNSARERKSVKDMQLNMKDARYNVLKTTLGYVGAGIEAMINVATECQYVETITVFVCNFSKPVPLNDFLQSQQQHSNTISTYVKNVWPSKISSGISIVLRPLGKGWLDISLDNWSIYKMCKIIRLILQTKFRMQDSMQIMLTRSIENFTHFLTDPCLQFLELTDSYKWPNNYINTDFPFPKPVFSLGISINEDEKVLYSTAPEEFEPAIVDIFKKALEKVNGVRCIDAETMQNLRFAPNLYILTVELIEDYYVSCDDLMKRCYRNAVIPLRTYAKLYECFIPFFLLNVNLYLKEYAEAHKSSVQVRRDILEHQRQKQELRDILPATITIGPFLVIVDPMKQYMIKKHIEIVKRIFEYYVQRMWDINEELLDQCLATYNKISERPQSIEHLYEIRDFGLTVPEVVDKLKADIQIMWLEYEMLDSFFYNLSDAQFAMKWEVYAWPHNIMQRLSTLRDEQKLDIEEFQRIHLSECVSFEERLESLNDEIQAFSLQFDPNKVMETAVDATKTWKVIKDLQKHGDLLKVRQELFGLVPLSLAFLDSIIEGFTPYRNLWGASVNLIKLEEATEGNPIAGIDLADVSEAITKLRNSLNQSFETFEEKPEIQLVATTFLQRLEEFLPVYNCIKWLKNENWLYMHWQELASRSGMEVKYSTAMNFQYLKRKLIMDHLELVHAISEKAEIEADEIRRAFEEEERRKEEELLALIRFKAMRKCRTDIM